MASIGWSIAWDGERSRNNEVWRERDTDIDIDDIDIDDIDIDDIDIDDIDIDAWMEAHA